ncbi:MAG: methyltransferase domain-containing protein [Candidatus Omnitrophota bacterium]|nr:MAG: methyltransferase domain-containing protein [Candidatus Omnitrophota bacterium]
MSNPECSQPNAEEFFLQARYAADRGDLEAVIHCLDQTLRHNPWHVQANANLAWLLSQRGEYRRALPIYARLLICRLWSAQAYLRTGQCAWFLARRFLRKCGDHFRWIRNFCEGWNFVLQIINEFLVRGIEFRKQNETRIAPYLRHYRTCLSHAPVQEIEYFKIAENEFILDCLRERKNAILLDLASGHSSFPSYLAVLGHNVVTAELDWSALHTQKKLRYSLALNHLHVAAGNFLSLPFRDEAFDAITIISSIEHIPEDGDRKTMRQLGRLLRPGGDLLITVPAEAHYSEQWTQHAIGHVYEEAGSQGNRAGFLRVYDKRALYERLIEPSGLELQLLSFRGETTQWGWLGFGRNFVDHRNVVHPCLFAAALCLWFHREIQWDEMQKAQWAVACLHLRKR